MLVVAVGVVASAPVTAASQEIFHSTQSANLKTAEMIRPGNLLFEISHRFVPPISEGAEDLWGFDGPVVNRLGLSYQATDRLLFGLLRSNLHDNLELNAKVGLAELGSEGMRIKIAAHGGVAWNTDLPEVVLEQPEPVTLQEDNEVQLYAQLIGNVLLGDRVAVGVVPTLIRNPVVESAEAETAFALGVQAQAYVTRSLSALAEWIFTEKGGLDVQGPRDHDTLALGIELETRGHFFKIVVTNQVRMNPTQVLGGAEATFDTDEIRVGFNITRVLSF